MLTLLTLAILTALGNACVSVRKNVNTFSPTELQALRDGVAAMKARPVTDPTSWRYQANIHGTSDTPAQPLWSQCEHGTQFFLSWHRMYLYYFERILRKASGNRKLSLPYWNYSDAPANRVLPLPFRNPGDPSNPLFVPGRFINDGSSLPASAVDYGTAFSQLDVFDFSFSLEGTPHAAVHVQVGGLMGSVPTAANDPIFWLHHANIDRLWEGWLGWGEGRHNPEEPHPWLDQTYTFYDENAQQVSLTGRQILNTRRQLRYRYDSLPPRPSPSPTRATSAPETRRAVQERREQRIAENTRLSLGQAPTTVTLRMEADPAANLREALERAEGLTSVQLVFEGVDYEPGSYYEIFINLPGDPAEARSDGPHFAGVIAPFVDPKHAGHALRVNVRPALARLQAQGLIGGTDLALTFVPRGPVPPQGQPPRPVTARMQAERLSLVIR